MERQIRLVAGALPEDDRVGVRLSVGRGGDRALALVYDRAGEPLAIMGYPFSELRLAATMALAIDQLAPASVNRLGLIGSGRLAPFALDGALAVRAVERVAVYSPNSEHREAFAAREGRRLGVPVVAVDSPERAVGAADAVLVSTNSPVATLRGSWLRPGQPVFGCGRPNEFDDDVYMRADCIVVSSMVHERGYYDTALDRPMLRLLDQGRIQVTELADTIAGRVRAGASAVFRESQGGSSDVALAAYAYDQALQRGLGTQADFA